MQYMYPEESQALNLYPIRWTVWQFARGCPADARHAGNARRRRFEKYVATVLGNLRLIFLGVLCYF